MLQYFLRERVSDSRHFEAGERKCYVERRWKDEEGGSVRSEKPWKREKVEWSWERVKEEERIRILLFERVGWGWDLTGIGLGFNWGWVKGVGDCGGDTWRGEGIPTRRRGEGNGKVGGSVGEGNLMIRNARPDGRGDTVGTT